MITALREVIMLCCRETTFEANRKHVCHNSVMFACLTVAFLTRAWGSLMRIRGTIIAIPVALIAALSPINVIAQEVKLIGSGASFPFPIYSAWFKDFSKQNKGVTVDYQAKGSGAGIQDFTNKTVDFAASDAAMTDEEIAKVADGVVLLPVTAGEIVPTTSPGTQRN